MPVSDAAPTTKQLLYSPQDARSGLREKPVVPSESDEPHASADLNASKTKRFQTSPTKKQKNKRGDAGKKSAMDNNTADAVGAQAVVGKEDVSADHAPASSDDQGKAEVPVVSAPVNNVDPERSLHPQIDIVPMVMEEASIAGSTHLLAAESEKPVGEESVEEDSQDSPTAAPSAVNKHDLLALSSAEHGPESSESDETAQSQAQREVQNETEPGSSPQNHASSVVDAVDEHIASQLAAGSIAEQSQLGEEATTMMQEIHSPVPEHSSQVSAFPKEAEEQDITTNLEVPALPTTVSTFPEQTVAGDLSIQAGVADTKENVADTKDDEAESAPSIVTNDTSVPAPATNVATKSGAQQTASLHPYAKTSKAQQKKAKELLKKQQRKKEQADKISKAKNEKAKGSTYINAMSSATDKTEQLPVATDTNTMQPVTLVNKASTESTLANDGVQDNKKAKGKGKALALHETVNNEPSAHEDGDNGKPLGDDILKTPQTDSVTRKMELARESTKPVSLTGSAVPLGSVGHPIDALSSAAVPPNIPLVQEDPQASTKKTKLIPAVPHLNLPRKAPTHSQGSPIESLSTPTTPSKPATVSEKPQQGNRHAKTVTILTDNA